MQITLQGDLLKLTFFFLQLQRLGETYRYLVTLKSSLTSFHFTMNHKTIFKKSEQLPSFQFFMISLKIQLKELNI